MFVEVDTDCVLFTVPSNKNVTESVIPVYTGTLTFSSFNLNITWLDCNVPVSGVFAFVGFAPSS